MVVRRERGNGDEIDTGGLKSGEETRRIQLLWARAARFCAFCGDPLDVIGGDYVEWDRVENGERKREEKERERERKCKRS